MSDTPISDSTPHNPADLGMRNNKDKYLWAWRKAKEDKL